MTEIRRYAEYRVLIIEVWSQDLPKLLLGFEVRGTNHNRN